MSKKTEKKHPRKSRGEKFAPKYGVEEAHIYKFDPGPDKLRIPPRGHPLFDESAPTTFDELSVQEIDRTGTMTDPIEVWTDPDAKILWVVDGRRRLLDIREVNRRRADSGREPVKPLIVPFDKKEEREAVARIRVKNYYRRAPKLSGMALDIRDLRAQGWSWEDCAKKLHVESDDPEQWCKKRLPLAFCVPEVRAAFDAGEFPLSYAPQFGGRSVDGSAALGKKEQLALLEQKRAEKQVAKDAPKTPSVTPKVRERIRHALSNGVSKTLCHQDQMFAEGIVAALSFVGGDTSAFKRWPDIDAAVREAILSRGKTESEETEAGDES